MPRRSSRAKPETTNADTRVTRRSVRGAASPEVAKKATPTKETKSPASKAKRGARSTSRRRGAAEENEEESIETTESETSEVPEVVEVVSPKKRTAKSPGRGRGRGRGRASGAARTQKAEIAEDDGAAEEPVKKLAGSPSRIRRSRSTGTTPQKDSGTPTRRRRGRAAVVAEEPEDLSEEEVPKVTDSPSAEQETRKRKRDEEKESEPPKEQLEKKQKVDAAISEKPGPVPNESEDAMETETATDVKEDTSKMETDGKAPKKPESSQADETTVEPSIKAKTLVAEPKAVTEPKTESKTTHEPDTEMKAPEDVEDTKMDVKPSSKEAETVVQEPETPREKAIPEVKEGEPQVNKANLESKEAEPVVKAVEPIVKETKPAVKEHVPEVKEPVSKVKETEPEIKSATTGEEVMETDTPKAEASEESDVTKEYVVINMADVPPSDSAEVTQCVPTEKTPRAVDVLQEQATTKETKTDALPTTGGTHDAPTESTAKMDTSKVDTAQMDTAKMETTNMDIAQMDTAKTDMAKMDTTNMDTAKMDTTNIDRAKMDTTNMDTAKMDTTNVDSKNGTTPVANSNGIAPDTVDPNVDPLFTRKYIRNPNLSADVNLTGRFSLVSYNILADCHIRAGQYSWMESASLRMEARHKRFIRELEYLHADVICLQEVSPEYYDGLLSSVLKASGYEGVFKKKVDDNQREGEATFFRTSKFSLVSSRGLAIRDLACKELEACGLDVEKAAAVKAFIDKPSVVLITQLRSVSSGAIVTVGNLHLAYEKLTKQDLQCIQMACAVKEVVSMSDGPTSAYVICGDFNAWPETAVYQLTKEGYLNDSSTNALRAIQNVDMSDGTKAALVNLWWKGFQHTSSSLRSCYGTVTGREPVSTRYEMTGTTKNVDYIWCGGATLEIAGVTQTAPESLISAGVPNAVFPSDHLSLKAELFFK